MSLHNLRLPKTTAKKDCTTTQLSASYCPSHPPTATVTTHARNGMAESPGRQSNPGLAGATTSVGRFWETVKFNARHAMSSEAPEGEQLLEVPPEESYGESCREMAELSYAQRLTGFFLVMGMGLVFMAIAFLMAPMVVVAPKKFAFFLTVGNAFCLTSTVFLVGVRYQLRCMFQSHRFEAACLYLGSLFLTLVCALWLKTSIGCLVFAVLQVGCLLWYALSYIPFARQSIGMVVTMISYAVAPIVAAAQACLW